MNNTPHINQTAEIAETILLPGDPLRARFIAENFLSNVKQFNAVRGALGFTGEYGGSPVSVMGTGMGIPSMGIYSHELINVFGVKNLIRIGSCGALQDNLKLLDLVIGLSASTNSEFGRQFGLPGAYAPCCSHSLLKKAEAAAENLGVTPHYGNILSSDLFYGDDMTALDKWRKMGVLAVEMEAAGLYMNAARYGVDALCILTVSDHIYTREETTAEQREKTFTSMIQIALSMA